MTWEHANNLVLVLSSSADSAMADKMLMDTFALGSKTLRDMRTKYNITAESGTWSPLLQLASQLVS